jgi:hypothetical protein
MSHQDFSSGVAAYQALGEALNRINVLEARMAELDKKLWDLSLAIPFAMSQRQPAKMEWEPSFAGYKVTCEQKLVENEEQEKSRREKVNTWLDDFERALT